MFGWLAYFGVVLVASLVLGRHLGRFRDACTEMIGMMAGMTIGMLGGFALGYGMAAATGRNLFLGNLIGVLLGAALGGWFGRSGGLMGIMDGSMGGIMGGSMGAMIAVMLYPDSALNWTGGLFGGAYVVGTVALTALIEKSTPEQAHMHWLLPRLLRSGYARKVPATSKAPAGASRYAVAADQPKSAFAQTRVTSAPQNLPKHLTATPAPPMQDYYKLLKVAKDADLARVEDAYLELLATADPATAIVADRALLTLRDPERRAMYDGALVESMKRQTQPTAAVKATAETVRADGRGDCCPTPKKKSEAGQLTSGPATSQPQPQARELATTAAARSANGQRSQVTHAGTNGQARQGQGPVQTQHNGQAQKGAKRSDYGGYDARVTSRSSKPNKRKHQGVYSEPGPGLVRQIAMGVGVGAAAILAIVIVVGLILSAVGGGSAQAAGGSYSNPAGAVYHAPGALPSQAQLEQQAVAATLGTDGVQTADLVLDDTNSSYKPAAIKVKKGVPVRLNLSEVGGSKDCRSVVRLPALGAQGFVEPGQVTPMDFTASQAGVYEFNCPMRMMNPSYLVVTD